MTKNLLNNTIKLDYGQIEFAVFYIKGDKCLIISRLIGGSSVFNDYQNIVNAPRIRYKTPGRGNSQGFYI